MELAVHARTSQQAADALGVAVGQIVKSLVFTGRRAAGAGGRLGGQPGGRGEAGAAGRGRIRRADPDTVRQATGYAIGGVPPVGHEQRLPAYVDRDLLQYELVYAAAGVPECVFPLTPDELVRVTDGVVEDLRAAPAPA